MAVYAKIKIKLFSTRMGFEPTRAEHNGLAVHRLNHSATLSAYDYIIGTVECFLIISANIHTP